jgi:hypothetical protein
MIVLVIVIVLVKVNGRDSNIDCDNASDSHASDSHASVSDSDSFYNSDETVIMTWKVVVILTGIV